MISLLSFLACFGWAIGAGLETRVQLNYVQYKWESEQDEERAVSSGRYDYTKIVPYDVDRDQAGRLFITTPKDIFSNPASLSVVSDESGPGGNLLKPYPNWAWHKERDCTAITSVWKVAIDRCHRLWLVDSGKIGDEQVCEPKILAFDLWTDRLVKLFVIPPEVAKNGSLAVQLVETEGHFCQKTRVHMSDLLGYGFVIYDGWSTWRVENEIFKSNPSWTKFNVGNYSATIIAGTSGIISFPRKYVRGGLILVKNYNSVKAHVTSADEWRNSKYSSQNIEWYVTNFTDPSQDLASTISKDSILFSSFATQMNLACWWAANPLEEKYIGEVIPTDPRLEFVSSMKIKQIGHGTDNEIIFVLANEFTKWSDGQMNFSEPNFRILTGKVRHLVKGTVCEPDKRRVIPTSIEEKAFNRIEN